MEFLPDNASENLEVGIRNENLEMEITNKNLKIVFSEENLKAIPRSRNYKEEGNIEINYGTEDDGNFVDLFIHNSQILL